MELGNPGQRHRLMMFGLANGFANNGHGQPRMQLDQATAHSPASRRVRRLRTGLDDRNLATDQKVGGSSPSERATETPGHNDRHVVSDLSASSSGRILAASSLVAAWSSRSA
jgi:hypothetical protein